MIESLVGSLSWIVHPAAGLALGLLASVLFSKRGRQWEAVAFASALLLLLAVLGADWDVHPAAGILLGYFGTAAFGNWRRRWPALLAALVASALFMALGADWMVYPLAVMGLIWLFTAAFSAVGHPDKTAAEQTPGALPEHAGGFSLGPLFGEKRETVAAAQPQVKRPQVKQPQGQPAPSRVAAAPDPYIDWMRDSRLPGEARAQLVALNLRTREALTQLQGLGPQGDEAQFSEAQYLARAIRDEYVPTAVNAYLKLPRTRADTAPIEGDKTGRDLLREQLDLLLNATQDIIDAALQSGGRELLTHQRFLEDRFAGVAGRKKPGDLDL